MLWELSVVEQRYRAVLEVMAGVPVTEVAERFGVSRQTVHRWLGRYQREGPAGLADRSHRPRDHPWRLSSDLEARICELRRSHRSWGPRRLVFEMDRRGYGRVSRSTVYRTLVRHGLIEPVPRRRRREQYRRWERPVAMQLWQLDVTASVYLADGTELKVVTGLDDHSRFCVIATVVRRATARPVCRAFLAAMAVYGVPEEVLTDNGKVFTGRFHRPPVEVLFERICRENGITRRLTKVRSPTTTGKIERLHQSLQLELLNDHEPFETLEAAQRAIDAWRDEYNTTRPHQSLGMAFPAARFAPEPPGDLALRLPPELRAATPPEPVVDAVSADMPPSQTPPPVPPHALEVDRVVPACGNMWLAGQQIWVGPALAGRLVTFWVDQTHLHVLADGMRLKTLPSRLSTADLAKLAFAGARPAGPAPLPASTDNQAIEIERVVNACGLVGVGGHQPAVGFELAGRRVTLRLEGSVMHVIADGQLLRTLACPVPLERRYRLRGARLAAGVRPSTADPIAVERRVSSRGSIMVATERIQVGLAHARKVVTVRVEAKFFRVIVDADLELVVPRTKTTEVRRYKLYAVQKTSRVRRTSSEATTSRVK